MGLDKGWRKKAVLVIKKHVNRDTPSILDIACGTGDLSLEILKQIPEAKITGIDLALPMLEIFRKKVTKEKHSVTIEEGDVESLRFKDNTFDAVSIGFGTRNFTNLETAFQEIYRTLEPGGIFVNLELSKPRKFPMKQLYGMYSRYVLPAIGKIVSKHKEAYSYLPDSIRRFPEREEIAATLKQIGFSECHWEDLSAGIVTMHIAIK